MRLSCSALAGAPDFGLDVAVVERQRIIRERDAGDLGVGQRQLLGGERREPRIVRAGADRAGEDEDFGSGHGGCTIDMPVRRCIQSCERRHLSRRRHWIAAVQTMQT